VCCRCDCHVLHVSCVALVMAWGRHETPLRLLAGCQPFLLHLELFRCAAQFGRLRGTLCHVRQGKCKANTCSFGRDSGEREGVLKLVCVAGNLMEFCLASMGALGAVSYLWVHSVCQHVLLQGYLWDGRLSCVWQATECMWRFLFAGVSGVLLLCHSCRRPAHVTPCELWRQPWVGCEGVCRHPRHVLKGAAGRTTGDGVVLCCSVLAAQP
jgi:hypothetical protein